MSDYITIQLITKIIGTRSIPKLLLSVVGINIIFLLRLHRKLNFQFQETW